MTFMVCYYCVTYLKLSSKEGEMNCRCGFFIKVISLCFPFFNPERWQSYIYETDCSVPRVNMQQGKNRLLYHTGSIKLQEAEQVLVIHFTRGNHNMRHPHSSTTHRSDHVCLFYPTFDMVWNLYDF